MAYVEKKIYNCAMKEGRHFRAVLHCCTLIIRNGHIRGNIVYTHNGKGSTIFYFSNFRYFLFFFSFSHRLNDIFCTISHDVQFTVVNDE